MRGLNWQDDMATLHCIELAVRAGGGNVQVRPHAPVANSPGSFLGGGGEPDLRSNVALHAGCAWPQGYHHQWTPGGLISGLLEGPPVELKRIDKNPLRFLPLGPGRPTRGFGCICFGSHHAGVRGAKPRSCHVAPQRSDHAATRGAALLLPASTEGTQLRPNCSATTSRQPCSGPASASAARERAVSAPPLLVLPCAAACSKMGPLHGVVGLVAAGAPGRRPAILFVLLKYVGRSIVRGSRLRAACRLVCRMQAVLSC
jgi:hypothetical protein